MSQERYGLPPQLFTAPCYDRGAQSRIAVDPGGTGFFEGRNFRISYEFDIATASSAWLKFSSPIDFILKLQSLSVDTGAIRFRAFRDGADSGGWEEIGMFSMNFTAEAAKYGYVRQATVANTGTLSPTSPATETIIVRASGATAHRNSVSADVGGERGLPAGSYFLQFENIAGSGNATGVYDLIWEERPDDLGQWLVEL